jgi:uncharacterized membrane protein
MSDEVSTPVEPAPGASPEITSDDKLWVLLAYIFSPLIPVILMLLEDKKNRPFIRAHNAQALVMGIVEVVIAVVLSWTVFLSCLAFFVWVMLIYWGIQGFQGKYVNIPFVTDFCKKQGWA